MRSNEHRPHLWGGNSLLVGCGFAPRCVVGLQRLQGPITPSGSLGNEPHAIDSTLVVVGIHWHVPPLDQPTAVQANLPGYLRPHPPWTPSRSTRNQKIPLLRRFGMHVDKLFATQNNFSDNKTAFATNNNTAFVNNDFAFATRTAQNNRKWRSDSTNQRRANLYVAKVPGRTPTASLGPCSR